MPIIVKYRKNGIDSSSHWNVRSLMHLADDQLSRYEQVAGRRTIQVSYLGSIAYAQRGASLVLIAIATLAARLLLAPQWTERSR